MSSISREQSTDRLVQISFSEKNHNRENDQITSELFLNITGLQPLRDIISEYLSSRDLSTLSSVDGEIGSGFIHSLEWRERARKLAKSLDIPLPSPNEGPNRFINFVVNTLNELQRLMPKTRSVKEGVSDSSGEYVVDVNNQNEFKSHLSSLSQFARHWYVERTAEIGHRTALKVLFSSGEVSEEYRGLAVLEAAGNGHRDIVTDLLASGLISEEHRGRAISSAAGNGHRDIVTDLLASGLISEEYRGRAISSAAKNGHRDIFTDLLASGQMSIMSFELQNTEQAMKWCSQIKLKLYDSLSRNDSQLMRLSGPFVGIGSGLVTLAARVASVGEAFSKGFTNIYDTPDATWQGVEQIVTQVPTSVFYLAFSPFEITYDILTTSHRMFKDSRDYSQSKRDTNAEETRLIRERSAVKFAKYHSKIHHYRS